MYDRNSERIEALEYDGTQAPCAVLLSRSHDVTQLDLEDLNVENAYFTSFDAVVRRQLDPVWHKVGPKTKQLVGDLATLRRLLTYVYALQLDLLSHELNVNKVIYSLTMR